MRAVFGDFRGFLLPFKAGRGSQSEHKLIIPKFHSNIPNPPFQKFKLVSLDCTALDKELVHNVSCSLRIVDRAVRLINIDVFVPVLVDSLLVNLALNHKTTLGFRPFPMNITEDMCEFVHGKQKQRVLSVLLGSAKDAFYNIQCPTTGYLGIRDGQIQLQDFGVVPSGMYRFDLTFLFNRTKPGLLIRGVAQYDNLLLYKV